MSQDTPEVDAWIAGRPDEQRPQVRQLAALVEESVGGLEEAVKWGRLTFTVDGIWHHWLCAVGATRKEVKLLFHKGSLLADPDGLLEGDGRYLRQVRHDVALANAEAVIRLVQDAVNHQMDMIEE